MKHSDEGLDEITLALQKRKRTDFRDDVIWITGLSIYSLCVIWRWL